MSSAPDTDRPLRRDAERNRQRILTAAAEVFAQRGLAASLDQIAAHAGVGVGTVYRRFPDKEALIEALFEQRIAGVDELVQTALDADDAWEGFLDFFTETITQQANDRGFKQVLLARDRDDTEQARRDVYPALEQVIARAQAQGRLRDDFTVEDMLLVAIMVSEVADIARDRSPDLWRRVLQMLIDGIVTSRSAPTPLPVPSPPSGLLGDAMRRRAARS